MVPGGETTAMQDRDAAVVAELRDRVPGLIAVYRFGSSVTGCTRQGSDLDLAVLATRPLAAVERFGIQEDLASRVHVDVDLVDLRAASTVMASQVVTTGLLLHEADRHAREIFEDFVYGRYARLNEERKGILERVAAEGTVYGG